MTMPPRRNTPLQQRNKILTPDRPGTSRGERTHAARAPERLGRCAAMILEVAEILVQPGEEEEFEAAYRAAVEHVLGSPGCRSARLTRGVENPSRFVLLVEWDSVAAHVDGFRASPAFTRWREGIGRFLVGTPRVEHFVPAGE